LIGSRYGTPGIYRSTLYSQAHGTGYSSKAHQGSSADLTDRPEITDRSFQQLKEIK